MNEPTERLRRLLLGPEGFEVVMEFMAEVGGDPKDYGLFQDDENYDFASVTPDDYASAMRLYFENVAESGFFEPDVRAAIESGTVDWNAVFDVVRSSEWAPPAMP